MKVWITKYALTCGIKEEEVPDSAVRERGTLFFKSNGGYFQFLREKDWHRDRESAVKRAIEMRQKKIASVKKQLAKLEAMTF